ncbi:MAG: methyltransferase domain-containing protein [Actinomycetota bacterium]
MASPFDDKARWFDEHYGSTRGQVRLRLVLERIDASFPAAPGRVLDAGGGSGAFAIPLAERGYEVTLLEPSKGMLEVARERVSASDVDLAVVEGSLDDRPPLASAPFDAVCCHAVLLYLDDPGAALSALRTNSRPGAVLSLLEKNRDGLSIRPGLTGDFDEAIRLLDDPVASGDLGIQNRSRSVDEWDVLLRGSGWAPESWVGVRLFSDSAPEDLAPERFERLLTLEREAGGRDPYRGVARLVHITARAV